MTEKIILNTEQDYLKIQSELNERKKPSKTLRFMMQALENYRQSKKMGWSRAWNKYHVVNFQSFKLNASDQILRQLTLRVIAAEAQQIPEAARQFIDNLLNQSQTPMGFVFFQEFTDQERFYEGAVVSYGRINQENKRFRDRLDVILESEVIDGYSQGLSRIRIYVDPYTGNKEPLWQATIDQPNHGDTAELFEHLAGLSWVWAEDKSRIWNHWIIDYIDYFGARQWLMKKSYFHVATPNPNCRIVTDSINDNKAA
jgi:hypothetical protein